jgi:hypothetical protein
MSIPLIAIGAAGAALLFAGSKEKATPGTNATPGVQATPTTQSTGGANGGATAPSHTGSEEFNGGADVSGAAQTPTDTPTVHAIPDDAMVLTENAGGPVETDPWAPTGGPSIDESKVKSGADALRAVTQIGEVTGKAAADAFQQFGTALGAIW